jgi:2-methylcitrate dehydratase
MGYVTDSPRRPGALEKLADWVLAPRAEDIPAAAVTQAKLLLLDSIGCGFAAFDEGATRAVLATLKDMGGIPQCTVIGSATKTSAPNAVLVNGALIRILDLNDYFNTRDGQIGGHPSDNIPVAVAAGEMVGAIGSEIIVAIVIGYEIYGRFKEAMDPDTSWDGVTASGLVAPAMAGRLMGLDANQIAHALALSAARSPTPLAVRHGEISAAKSVANALVAQNGMQATILAKNGMTGPLDLFENPHGLQSVFDKFDLAATITDPLPAVSYVMSAHMKAYPCLATGQGIVAAGLDIHRQVGGDVDKLVRVKVAIADQPSLRKQKDDPGRIDPKSREAADHSFNFLAAVSMLDGKFGLAQFDDERWDDPKVRALMAKLDIVCDAALNSRSPGGFPCVMSAKGADDRNYVAEVLDPPGFSRTGIDPRAVIDKFNAITERRLSASARQRVIDAAMDLDRAHSPAALMAAIVDP